jgi:hypothetical protein
MKFKILTCILAVSLLCGCGKKTAELESVNSDSSDTKTEETTIFDADSYYTTQEESETTTEETTETTTEETTEETTETTTEEITESTTEKQTERTSVAVEKKETQSKPDISYKGVDIHLGDNADDVASKLELAATSSNISKAGEGKIYSYDSVNLSCHSKNGKTYYIDKIEITSDELKTPAGMCVGKTLEELQSAYGDASQTDGNTLKYTTTPDRYMYFVVTDGKISKWGVALG